MINNSNFPITSSINNSQHRWGLDHTNDLKEFRKVAKDTIDFIVETQLKLNEKPVTPILEPNFMDKLIQKEIPNQPTSFSEVLNEAHDKVLQNTTHWNHPGFLTWYPSMTQYPAILGNLISDCFNNPNVSWLSNPSGFELEKCVMNWLKEAFDLPPN